MCTPSTLLNLMDAFVYAETSFFALWPTRYVFILIWVMHVGKVRNLIVINNSRWASLMLIASYV